jgi:anti-sigma factor RsiW
VSCAEAVELISALLDGELGVSDTVRLQHHLGDCEACRAAQASEMWLHALLAAGALTEAPPDFLRPRIQEHIAREAASVLRGRAPWWRRALFPAVVSGALSLVAVLVLLVHLPGGGLGESPILADAVVEHRRYSVAETPSLGITVADVHRLEQWIGAQLGLKVKLPAGAARGEAPVGARVVAVAGRPAAQILYAGDGRHISLFVARKPSRPLPEEGEHIIDGREVYISALGASHLGWWEDRKHLYLVVSSAEPEDLLALAELCMRTQRSRQARPPIPMQTQRRRVARAVSGARSCTIPAGKADRRGA